MGTARFVPASAERLIYLTLPIRNDAPIACDLYAGSDAILPTCIDRDSMVNAFADKVESYNPDDERGRRMIYSRRARVFPTRLTCGLSTFELPRS